MTADDTTFEVEMGGQKEEASPDFYEVSLGSAPADVRVLVEEADDKDAEAKVVEGRYVIESKLCRETVLKAAAGWNVTVGTGTGEERQVWEILKFGRGYRVLNKASGLVLHMKTCRGGGAPVQREWDGSDAQLWRVLKSTDGYRLMHRNGLALSVKKESGANRGVCLAPGASQPCPEQHWIFRSVEGGESLEGEPLVLDDVYTIVASGNSFSSAKLSASSTANPALTVCTQPASKGQHWAVRRVAESHYQILDASTSLTLAVSQSSGEVTLTACSSDVATHLWELQRPTAWTVVFTHKPSGRVLGVAPDGNSVGLFPPHEPEHTHRWYLNPVPRSVPYWRTTEGFLALCVGVVGFVVLIGFVVSLRTF